MWVFLTKGHVVPVLLVGDGTARHPILFLVVEDRTILTAVAANGTEKPAPTIGFSIRPYQPITARRSSPEQYVLHSVAEREAR
ncbi:MAG: hypothetical protein CML23_14885 [Rhizobiaceae bacterium]|nr:hypothetical protein [Rhizobiaceae bacterium]